MYVKIFFTSFLILALGGVIQAQKVLLDSCLQKASRNSPLVGNYKLQHDLYQLKSKSLDASRMPQLATNAQATYQSAVTELPIKIPGIDIPAMHKGQYKLSFDANQLIYGGHMIAYQAEVDQSDVGISDNQIETAIYQVRDRVCQIYFGILLSEANIKVLLQSQIDLQSRLSRMQHAADNGIVLQSAVNSLKAEAVRVDQKILELTANRHQLIQSLSVLTGDTLPASAQFVEPIGNLPTILANQRPEAKAFGLLDNKISLSENLITARKRPKIYGFGSVGYGRPGFDMFNPDADVFAMVGIKFSWNVYDWGQSGRDRQTAGLSRDLLKNQERAYNQAVTIEVQKYRSEIEKTLQLSTLDKEVVQLREQNLEAAASQLDNGLIPVSDYITEQSALEQARLQQTLHHLQGLQAVWMLKSTLGAL